MREIKEGENFIEEVMAKPSVGFKVCPKCGNSKVVEDFYLKQNGKRACHCKKCHAGYSKSVPSAQKDQRKLYRDKNRTKILVRTNELYRLHYKRKMFNRAKLRASKKGLEFNIEESDITIPTHCPVYGFELQIGLEDQNTSPCLDRVDNNKGYIKGNIVVVSAKANRVKGDGTLEEHRKIRDFYRNLEINRDAAKREQMLDGLLV